MSHYLFVGDHAETLASGRRIAPGDDLLPATAIDENDPVDKRLIDEGILVATKEKAK